MKLGSINGRKWLLPRVMAMIASVALLGSACSSGSAGGSADQQGGDEGAKVKLTYASFTAPTSPHAKAFDWLADQLQERTDGRVSIERFYASSLCGVNEIMACQEDGRADMGIWLPWIAPNDFPLASVVGVPFVTRDTWADTMAFNELATGETDLKAEFDEQGLRFLYAGPVGPAILGTNEKVESLDWVKGKSIRTTGYLTDAFKLLGANPVAIPNADQYQALQRGVINAFYATTLDGAAIDNSLFEVTKYWYDIGAGEYANVVTTISDKAFKKLSTADQQVLSDLVGELNGKFWDDYYFPAMKTACDRALNGGVKVMEVWQGDKVEKFQKVAADAVKDKWIAASKKAGAADPAKFFETYSATVKSQEDKSKLGLTATERCAKQLTEQS